MESLSDFFVPPPPKLTDMRAGSTLVAGLGVATILPDMDFETYSEAGYVWNDALGKWESPEGCAVSKRGLEVTGAAVYAEHPTCEVLSFSYDLKDGCGDRLWRPGDPPPVDLFEYLATGGLIEAWNVGFECWVWTKVCVPRYGWPPLPATQLRCAMAKARAFALPGKLDNASDVCGFEGKDPEGSRLIRKFCVPVQPTKTRARRRILPSDEPEEAAKLYAYNRRDIKAEGEVSSVTPDLSADELEFWQLDQEINRRGLAVDTVAIRQCIVILQQAYAKYNPRLSTITDGAVPEASQLAKLQKWLATRGVHLAGMDEASFEYQLNLRGIYLKSAKDDAFKKFLALPGLDPLAREALAIRYSLASASVKKLYALLHQTTTAGRVHDLLVYYGARTGRETGSGVQPQNLPKDGPELFKCSACEHWFGAHTHQCPWCATIQAPDAKQIEWTVTAVEDALTIIGTGSLECVELFFGDALLLISGCLRALFIAPEGYDLIASDFSSIEAVVLAILAGEQWRIDVFATHGKIYEVTASKVTGIPFERFIDAKKQTGSHLPERQSVGKCLELACGYGGWINATKAPNIRMDRFFTDDQIRGHIINWRNESPKIVELWGGQHREPPWSRTYAQSKEFFGLEGAAIQAVLFPGSTFTYREISYFMRGDVLYCRLPNGRCLVYHHPRLTPSTRADDEWSLSFEGWNSNPNMGAPGWVRMYTYGGKLTENVVQAICRDLLFEAMRRLARAGYDIVLHVHDEIIAQALAAFGSIEEFERIMAERPGWWPAAWPWPVKASGGWRGKRYRKD